MLSVIDKITKWYVGNFPINKGKHGLIKYASSRHLPGYSITVKNQFGAMMDLELSQYVDAQIYYRGVYEEPILNLCKVLSKKYSLDFMLDIGANVGQHSLFGAMVCDMSIKAFEANIDTYKKLEKNITLNAGTYDITIENIALSDSTGFVDIVVDNASNSGQAYITQVGAEHNPSKLVPSVLLDDYIIQNHIGNRGIIKLDVEGAEGMVLRGARGLLKSGKIKGVIVEIVDSNLSRFGDTPQGVYQFMMDCGYIALEIVNSATRPLECDEMPGKCDVLFVFQGGGAN